MRRATVASEPAVGGPAPVSAEEGYRAPLAGSLQFAQFAGSLGLEAAADGDADVDVEAASDDEAAPDDAQGDTAGETATDGAWSKAGAETEAAEGDAAEASVGDSPGAAQGSGSRQPAALVAQAAAAMAAMPRRAAPYQAELVRAFGPALLQRIAWIDGADELLQALGPEAMAFTYRGQMYIALREGASLRVAAHEVAHHAANVKAAPRLADGVGQAGDAYEQQADVDAARAERGDIVSTDAETSVGGVATASPVAQASGIWSWVKKQGASARRAIATGLNKTPAGRALLAVGKAGVAGATWVGGKVVQGAKAVGNAALTWGPMLAGAVAGVVKGVLLCVRDVVLGVVDLLKMVWGLVKVIYKFVGDLTRDAAGTFEKIWDRLAAMPGKLGAAIRQAPGAIWKKFTDASSWGKGMMLGTAIGYIAAMVLLIVFTGGAAAATLAASRFGWIIRVINFFDKAGDIFFIAGRSFKAGKAAGRMASDLVAGGVRATRATRAVGDARSARASGAAAIDASNARAHHADEVPQTHQAPDVDTPEPQAAQPAPPEAIHADTSLAAAPAPVAPTAPTAHIDEATLRQAREEADYFGEELGDILSAETFVGAPQQLNELAMALATRLRMMREMYPGAAFEPSFFRAMFSKQAMARPHHAQIYLDVRGRLVGDEAAISALDAAVRSGNPVGVADDAAASLTSVAALGREQMEAAFATGGAQAAFASYVSGRARLMATQGADVAGAYDRQMIPLLIDHRGLATAATVQDVIADHRTLRERFRAMAGDDLARELDEAFFSAAKPYHKIGVELEVDLTDDLLARMTTTNGLLGPLLPQPLPQPPPWLAELAGGRPLALVPWDELAPHQQRRVINWACQDQQFFATRRIRGLAMREAQRDGFGTTIEHASANPVHFGRDVELHWVATGGAGDNLQAAVNAGTEASGLVPNVHAHQAVGIAGTDDVAFHAGFLTYYIELDQLLTMLAASLQALKVSKTLGGAGVAFNYNSAEKIRTMWSALTDRFAPFDGDGMRPGYTADLKTQAIGFRLADNFEAAGTELSFGVAERARVVSFEQRIFADHPTLGPAFADLLQRDLLTGNFVADADYVARLTKLGDTHAIGEAIVKTHYNQPIADLLAAAPPHVEALLDDIVGDSSDLLREYVEKHAGEHYQLKMLLFDWRNDPVIAAQPELLAKVSDEQARALKEIIADPSYAATAGKWFALESGIPLAYARKICGTKQTGLLAAVEAFLEKARQL